ncbi:ATPase components of ABC transporters with duplicated ATPase domains [Enhydrobacter aerosaccus]|uniref:ATPase components of ABC transporters with duplicated ATPase domains n=1 Tax=Enhydrobacter aerosaccus TaxID=225324 RepID=A0A1T4K4E6_9HYPH|nr:ABC-F family ATP-binding cassette domain-containing protein [Enhydrobacter aerosaccus]SJZ37289.1 ATPase components of ABC transporters with duplicated ATPase domains [Enhydrobacter aerosaccus]
MSASIVLSGITWSTPDGWPLLSDLDLSFDSRRTGLIGRNGVGKSTLLKLVSGELSPQVGSVTVSGTTSVLRQAVQVEAGRTVADLFGVRDDLALLRRTEHGEATAEELERADWTLETRMTVALVRFGLDVPPEADLACLSGGQRTRVGLAALVFDEPDFILLDEPTNNLDREGRAAVIELLAGWRSGAIVVSHDRALLETMDTIVELTTLGATVYGGNWSHYRARKGTELAAAQHDLADAERRAGELARRAQDTAERQARRDSAGKRKRAKGDMPRIQMNTLRSNSENTGGEQARLAERRRTTALEEVAAARRRIEVLQPLSVVFASTGLPAAKTILHVDSVTVGYEPDRPILRDMTFSIVGPERVAIAGANGTGKTTLLSVVTGALKPWNGRVRIETPFALLDQQVSLLHRQASIRDNFLRLNPASDENGCRAALARFMFRADAALQIVSRLSGGQMLRAGLACVLGGKAPPPLLILDEPTNHLDLDSIEAVEAGLRAYDGALLVVSHDEAFLASVGISRRIELTKAAR